jgi:hypothetical protein
MAKKLERLDAASHVCRHLTVPRMDAFLAALEAQVIGNSSTCGDNTINERDFYIGETFADAATQCDIRVCWADTVDDDADKFDEEGIEDRDVDVDNDDKLAEHGIATENVHETDGKDILDCECKDKQDKEWLVEVGDTVVGNERQDHMDFADKGIGRCLLGHWVQVLDSVFANEHGGFGKIADMFFEGRALWIGIAFANGHVREYARPRICGIIDNDLLDKLMADDTGIIAIQCENHQGNSDDGGTIDKKMGRCLHGQRVLVLNSAWANARGGIGTIVDMFFEGSTLWFGIAFTTGPHTDVREFDCSRIRGLVGDDQGDESDTDSSDTDTDSDEDSSRSSSSCPCSS